jgi:hypothetical protein
MFTLLLRGQDNNNIFIKEQETSVKHETPETVSDKEVVLFTSVSPYPNLNKSYYKF